MGDPDSKYAPATKKGMLASSAGIGTRTLLRWLKVPEFQAAYRQARREAFGPVVSVKRSMTLGQVLKCVAEPFAVGCIREAEAREVGCNHMVAVRQGRNEVAEHVRRRGEAVQQENRWVSFRAGFAIKNLGALDEGMVIAGHSVSPQRLVRHLGDPLFHYGKVGTDSVLSVKTTSALTGSSTTLNTSPDVSRLARY